MSKLQNRDYVVVIDKSSSMEAGDTKSGKSRWEEAKELVLGVISKVSQFDPDGITLYFFNGSYKRYDNVTAERALEIYNSEGPAGSTTLGPVLADVFNSYNTRKKAGETKANGELLVVVTDGQPSDESAVAREIVKFGNGLANADDEYGMTFLQVGRDTSASAFLKRLDDGLKAEGAQHDIVDTKTMEELENTSLQDVLMAALDD